MGRNLDIAPKKVVQPVVEEYCTPPAPVFVPPFVAPRPPVSPAPPIATPPSHGRMSSERITSFFLRARYAALMMRREARRCQLAWQRIFARDTFFGKMYFSLRLKFQLKQYRLRVFFRSLTARHAFLRHPASPFRMLRPSRLALIGAVVLGMVMTHTVERLVNGNASADTAARVAGDSTESSSPAEALKNLSPSDLLALASADGNNGEKPFEMEILSQFIDEGRQDKFDSEVRRMVAGYPIESMIPFILEKDRITATFLIGIAKKESNWGRRVPVLDGQDCYNYWGFREKRRLMGTGGHTCFNGKKDAVDSVSKRIENLIYDYERNTPEKMIIWKCGYTCAGHDPESVRKWIADVEGYYNALNDAEKE